MSGANSSRVLGYFIGLMENIDLSTTVRYEGLTCKNVQPNKYLSYSEQRKVSLFSGLVFLQ